MDERSRIQQEINNLQADLTSSASPIGDWKVVKSYEYFLAGMEIPYDFVELNQKRQAVRDRISELRAQLEAMPDDEQNDE